MNDDRLLDAAQQILHRHGADDPLLIAIEDLLATADDEWFARFCRVAGVNDPDRFRASLREAAKRRRH